MTAVKGTADSSPLLSFQVGSSLSRKESSDAILEAILPEDRAAVSRLEKLGYLTLPIGKMASEDARQVYAVLTELIPLIATRLAQDNSRTHRKLVELLVDRTPPTPALLLQSKMQARAITRVMDSGDWLTAQQVAEIGHRSKTNPSAHTSKWKKLKQIFSIPYKSKDYYPGYGLDPAQEYRPLPALKPIIEAFGEGASGWELAFWFDSPNSYLGGKRPKERLAEDPEKVLCAAQLEVRGVEHG